MYTDSTLSLTSSDEPSFSDPGGGGDVTYRIASFEARADFLGVMTGRMTLHISADTLQGPGVLEGCLGNVNLFREFSRSHLQSPCIGWLSRGVD